MARISQMTVITAVRRLLGAVLLVMVGILGLYLFGRQGGPDPDDAPEDLGKPDTATEEEDFSVKGEGFEFALSRGDEIVFQIRGDEQRSDRSGMMFLSDVEIKMMREEGLYEVEGKSAVYNPENRDSRLEGDVVVHGPEGLYVESAWLDVDRGGTRIFAQDGVRFRSTGRLEGRADALRADLERKELTLTGNVVLDSEPTARVPFRLETRELVVREGNASLHARGGVRIESGGDTFSAQRLSAFLHPESRELEHVRLMWEVKGEIVPDSASGGREGYSQPEPIAVEGTTLKLDFDDSSGDLRSMELRGLARRPASLVQLLRDGTHQAVSMVTMTGYLENGILRRSDLLGDVEIVQVPSDPSLGERRAVGRSGEGRFGPDGKLEGLTLIEDVRIWDGQGEATGERAYFDLASNSISIFGETVHVVHTQGTLEAPHVTFHLESSLLHARGGVRARMEGNAAGGLSSGLGAGDSSEPLRVVAGEGFWRQDPPGVMFRGEVRAWQGENTLFAEQLRGEPTDGSMSASGGVRTVWQPAGDSGEEVDGSSSPEAPSETSRGRTEVTSENMFYREQEHQLVYSGAVQAEQIGSRLRCGEMTILLDEENQARQMICETEVLLDDIRNGRSLEGDRAIYDPRTSVVEVFGEHLVMSDPDGALVEGGRYFEYHLEDGSLRLSSKQEPDLPERATTP